MSGKKGTEFRFGGGGSGDAAELIEDLKAEMTPLQPSNVSVENDYQGIPGDLSWDYPAGSLPPLQWELDLGGYVSLTDSTQKTLYLVPNEPLSIKITPLTLFRGPSVTTSAEWVVPLRPYTAEAVVNGDPYVEGGDNRKIDVTILGIADDNDVPLNGNVDFNSYVYYDGAYSSAASGGAFINEGTLVAGWSLSVGNDPIPDWTQPLLMTIKHEEMDEWFLVSLPWSEGDATYPPGQGFPNSESF